MIRHLRSRRIGFVRRQISGLKPAIVPACSLDDRRRDSHPINYVSCDDQGPELGVVAGAARC